MAQPRFAPGVSHYNVENGFLALGIIDNLQFRPRGDPTHCASEQRDAFFFLEKKVVETIKEISAAILKSSLFPRFLGMFADPGNHLL